MSDSKFCQVNFKRNCRLGYAMKMHLYLDDVKIGTLKNKRELSHSVPFGNHKITGHLRGGRKEEIYIEFSPDKEVVNIDCVVELATRTFDMVGNVRFYLL